ncbi:MAG: hypothetical protein AAGD05_08215 [Bacteroidota bacterium]
MGNFKVKPRLRIDEEAENLLSPWNPKRDRKKCHCYFIETRKGGAKKSNDCKAIKCDAERYKVKRREGILGVNFFLLINYNKDQ